jgi:copper chaperone CopZ
VKIIIALLLTLSVLSIQGIAGDNEEATISIEGDMCKMCADSLSTVLKNVEGVTSVKVCLEEKQAVIEHKEVTLAKLQEAMTTAGYVVDKEKNSVKDKCNKENCAAQKSCCQQSSGCKE